MKDAIMKNRKLIGLVQRYPNLSFSEISRMLGISTQTVIRKVEHLKKKGILRAPIATLDASKIGLKTYILIFTIKNKEQFENMFITLNSYNYIRSFNYFYGEKNGFFAFFEIPEEHPEKTHQKLMKFLSYLEESNFYENLIMDQLIGESAVYYPPYPNSGLNKKNFSLSLLNQELKKRVGTVIPAISISKLNQLKPLDLLVLFRITGDYTTSQMSMLREYRKGKKLTDKNGITKIEALYIRELKKVFDGRTENAIKMDLSRSFRLVKDKLVKNPRWNIDRTFLPETIQRIFLLKNLTSEEKGNLFRIVEEAKKRVKKSHPALKFQTVINFAEKYTYFNILVPYYYDTKISWIISQNFNVEQSFITDYFGYMGTTYHLQLQNINFDTMTWRTDDYWMYEEPIEIIEKQIKRRKVFI